MSYENMTMYSAVLPCYDDEKDDFDESKDANNPDNFKGEPDEVEIR